MSSGRHNRFAERKLERSNDSGDSAWIFVTNPRDCTAGKEKHPALADMSEFCVGI